MKKLMLIVLAMVVLCGCVSASKHADFNTVVSSLDTPWKIDQYQRSHFSYAQTWEGYGCGGTDISVTSKGCSPEYILRYNKGNCAAFSVFAVHCLRQAGYEAYVVKVESRWAKSMVDDKKPTYSKDGTKSVKSSYHYISVYKDGENWWVIDNGTPHPRGIKGPFSSIERIPYTILKIEK